MSLAIALLAPFALYLPVAEAADDARSANSVAGRDWRDMSHAKDGAEPDEQAASDLPPPVSFQFWPRHFVSHSFVPDSSFQVRIEQSVRIRIAPRPTASVPQSRPNMLVGVPNRAIGTNMVERRMGKCVKVKSIAGVQASSGKALVLYLRDRRMVRAKLERACRAKDFYSGFYLSRSADGRLCVDRDSLQSRSGANCKLTQMRQLVESGN